MAVPVVAIVGRPNVGKSSLFNWLAGRRISIVDPTAGVTRDRVGTLVKEGETYFELIDTGGIGIEDADNLTAEVEGQIQTALHSADLILFVVEARSGRVPLDEEVAVRLRGIDKPVILVVNKCDTPELDDQVADFFRMGYKPMVPVSAEQKRGRADLLKQIVKRIPETWAEDAPRDPVMKLAIVGRQNVGKSTFINSLAHSERMIVSEVAGTTRDSVDVRFERDGQAFVAIDTAGVQRKRSIGSSVEFYSMARAERSIRRADVVLMFFDPRLRVSRVDKTLVEYIHDEHKPVVFVANKWDLVLDRMVTSQFGDYLRASFSMLDYVPIAFITAQDGKNVQKLLNLSQNMFKQAAVRVTTGDLNRILREALVAQTPPMRQNRRPKIYYATQVAASPPTIVLFTNSPDLFDEPYKRYLLRWFRDRLPFGEVPIKLHLRAKNRDESAPDLEAIVQGGDGPRQRVAARPAKAARDKKPDAAGLKFRAATADDDDLDADLWQDL